MYTKYLLKPQQVGGHVPHITGFFNQYYLELDV